MSNSKPALLFVQTDVDAENAAAFNLWYDKRHLPDREATAGFGRCSRYESVSGRVGVGTGGPLPHYLALYELANVAVLESDAYRSLNQPPRFADEDRAMLRLFRNVNRAVLEQISETRTSNATEPARAGGLLAVGLVPDAAHDEEYNAWYDEEHIPFIIDVGGVLRARRFRAIEGDPAYLALYELTSPDVRHSEAFERAIDTPWSSRIRKYCQRRLTGLFVPHEKDDTVVSRS